jgi:hypothetical protein
VGCSNSFSGVVSLQYKFTPLEPKPPGGGWGCAADTFSWPPILERVEKWTLLHPAGKITLKGDRAALHCEEDDPGEYEFWAEYGPPFVSPEDQKTLQDAGIDFPRGELTTQRIVFTKKP